MHFLIFKWKLFQDILAKRQERCFTRNQNKQKYSRNGSSNKFKHDNFVIIECYTCTPHFKFFSSGVRSEMTYTIQTGYRGIRKTKILYV